MLFSSVLLKLVKFEVDKTTIRGTQGKILLTF